MVEDTAGRATGGDPLPLLAFTLRQLYEHRANPARITFDDYTRIGGVIGALKEEADRTTEALQRRGLGAEVVPMLLELVHVEADREPTGRSVRRSSFVAAGQQVVDAFVDARLLTTDGDEGTVHVAHEALLREWPVLVRAIDGSRDQLIARARLERDAREWEAARQDPSYLIGGRRLKGATGMLAADARPPEPTVSAFISASKRRAARQAWRTRLVIGLVGLLVAAGVVVGVQTLLSQIQEGERKDAARGILVSLQDGADVEQHEVTNHQYQLCVKQGRCPELADSGLEPPDFVKTGDTAPVVMVTAVQAATFCAWIGRRLPASAELTAASSARDVIKDLLRGGGKEWTSTKHRGAFLTVGLSPDGKTHLLPADQLHGDWDIGFRCAQHTSAD
jgi:hypothetical protein